MPNQPAVLVPRAPWPRTWAHPINAFVLGSLWIASAAVFESLPDRIPMHFGLDGTPDRWAVRTWGSWMALPIIASAVTAITYGAAWFAGLNPRNVNLPDKKRYDALPSESQFVVIHVVQRFVLWLTVGINLVMAIVHAGSWVVATGQAESLPWWAMGSVLALLLSSPFSTVVIVLRTNSVINRLSKRHE